MILSLSAALLLGIAVAALCRWAGLRVWHALLCVLFGFYLAGSSFAPLVSDAADALFSLLTG